MVNCPNCGEEIGDTNICPNCGVNLNSEPIEGEIINDTTNEAYKEIEEETIVQESATETNENKEIITIEENNFCTSCGKEITSNVSFCPNCGTKINQTPIKSQQIQNNTKFCQNCGSEIDEKAVICPHCGVSTGIQTTIIQKNTKFCQNCGSEIDEKAVICPHCGVSTGMSNSNKSAGLAFLLTFLLGGLIPGIGHIYLGLTKKGIILTIIYWACWFLIWLIIPGIFIIIILLYVLINSYTTGTKIANGEHVDDW